MISPNFRDDWLALGLSVRKPRKKAASPQTSEETVRAWLESPHESTYLTVAGPTPQSRAAIYQRIAGDPWHLNINDTRLWHTLDPMRVFIDFAANQKTLPMEDQPQIPHVRWGWLRQLCVVRYLFLSDPLRMMAARGTSLFFDTALVLFEIRFRIQEGAPEQEVDELFEAFVAWLTGATLTEQQNRILTRIQKHVGGIRTVYNNVTVLLFLMTLAEQNNIIERSLLVFDDVETMLTQKDRQRLKGLYDLLTAFTRWACRFSTPMSVMVGFDVGRVTELKRVNGLLARELIDRFRCKKTS